MNPLLLNAISHINALPDADQAQIANMLLREAANRQRLSIINEPAPAKIIKSIYTDGAYREVSNVGGWGVVIIFADGTRHEMGGKVKETTSTRMELQAAIAALEFLKQTGQKDPIELYTDSKNILSGITQHVHSWKKNRWRNKKKKAVADQDLWEILDNLNQLTIRWEYVQSHSGNPGNERCDRIARTFAGGRKPKLQQIG